jgi:hypothetical protein
MANTSIPSSASFAGTLGRVAAIPMMGTRRAGHGGTAWSLPLAEKSMRQPQDGAIDTRARLATINSHLHSDALREPEDARLTGGTRSLTRRLLGLNVVTRVKKVPEPVRGPIARTNVA